ncbi:MAG: stage II sporulation protein SpoIID, partial [Bacilli bacterium]
SIPDNIGNVQNIFVSNRGSSGVVISLDIVTSTGEYRIINQYNIRFTIRPRDAGSNVYTYFAKNTDTSYLGPSTNASVLNSGFFAIEYAADEVTFYGGGNGHGVGMSQYGAYGLATQGKNYEEILNTYYSNVDFTDITYLYTPIDNYRDYF